MNKEKIIDELVDKYYFYPSWYNLFDRMCAYLEKKPTKEQYKLLLKWELNNDK